jgi:hypothetical protein
MGQSFIQTTVQGDAITARMQHRTVVHRGHMYVVMGYNGVSRLADMFYSNNARYWKRKSTLVDTSNNDIVGREAFGLQCHNEKVYLLGGYDGSNYLNEVYVTNDMVRWQKLQNAPWDGRYGFVTFSFDNRLWVMGGIKTGPAYLNDVWWTRDGVRWTQEPNAPWEIRGYHAGLVYSNMMYVVGGLGAASARYNDVYYTTNGRIWTRMESSAAFTGRDGHSVTAYGDSMVNSRMVLIGGQTGAGTYSAELYHSGNGNQWKQGVASIPMGNLRGHTVNYFDARLIVIGGLNGAATYRNEVWASQGQQFKAAI